jgi:hypothetical protein
MNFELVKKLSLTLVFCILPFASNVFGQAMVEPYLIGARLDEGEGVLLKHLAAHADDDNVRFELGVLQFMQSLEHLGQSMHRYGVDANRNIPLFRLPVEENENPDPITYAEFKDVFFQTMLRDLKRADATLASIDSKDVHMELHLFQVHLDWNGDGVPQGNESFGAAVSQVMGQNAGRGMQDKAIKFDKADVHWLRGYCNLLSAMCELALAYDQEDMWDVVARRFIGGAQVRHDFLMEEPVNRDFWWNTNGLIDYIAGVHNMGFPLEDARGLERAHKNVMTTIEQSRLMWASIQAETDNDREWIPNPKQTSVVSRVRFSAEMVKGWTDFLDEAEKVMKGELLIPFWRGKDKTRGVNLYRVFHEPREFDLVLWVHGSGVVPYLEKGQVTNPATWSRFERIFQGDFIGFATWIN